MHFEPIHWVVKECMASITPNSVAQLFRQILLGRNVSAEKISPFRIPASEASATAIYANVQGEVAGACIADIDLVHRAGAALCLIPADARLKAAKFDTALAENFREILNICAQLFGGPEQQRMSLASVAFSAGTRPADVTGLLSSPAWRLDVKLMIADYGSGRISVLSDRAL